METSLNTLKNLYAQEHDCEDWDELANSVQDDLEYEQHWTEICIRAQKAALEKAAEKYDWINVADKLPLTLPRNGWDGKVSDLVLMRNSEGRIFVGHFNDGFIDGTEFNEWYTENEFTVHGINYWCEIPDFHSTSITNPENLIR